MDNKDKDNSRVSVWVYWVAGFKQRKKGRKWIKTSMSIVQAINFLAYDKGKCNWDDCQTVSQAERKRRKRGQKVKSVEIIKSFI